MNNSPASVAFKMAMLINKLNLNQEETLKLIDIIKCVNSFNEGDQSQFDTFLYDYISV